MENRNNKDGFVRVRSIKLLKTIAENRLVPLLAFVNLDVRDGYPIYGFINKPDLKALITKFVTENGADSRSLDTENDWRYYNKEVFNDIDNQELVLTRNYNCVQKIICNGYGGNLVRVFKDNNNRKCFGFISHPDIVRIKAECDIESRDIYNNKIKAEENI